MAESTGRSGSLFYRTPGTYFPWLYKNTKLIIILFLDKRYFFKTIQPAEVACMLNMLEGYYQVKKKKCWLFFLLTFFFSSLLSVPYHA